MMYNFKYLIYSQVSSPDGKSPADKEIRITETGAPKEDRRPRVEKENIGIVGVEEVDIRGEEVDIIVTRNEEDNMEREYFFLH